MFYVALYLFICTALLIFMLRNIKEIDGEVTVKDLTMCTLACYIPFVNLFVLFVAIDELTTKIRLKEFWNKKVF